VRLLDRFPRRGDFNPEFPLQDIQRLSRYGKPGSIARIKKYIVLQIVIVAI
jgi:hypothetical protein